MLLNQPFTCLRGGCLGSSERRQVSQEDYEVLLAKKLNQKVVGKSTLYGVAATAAALGVFGLLGKNKAMRGGGGALVALAVGTTVFLLTKKGATVQVREGKIT